MRKTTTFALLAVALIALGCGSGAGDDAKGGDNKAGSDEKPGKKSAKIGDAVRDGKFEFTVTTSKCGVAKVGDSTLGAQAQGQYCLITVTVKNIGKESQLFSDSSQKAFTADGKQFSTDTNAAIYANKNAETFLNEINPGNQVTGVLVFDVPKNAKLTKLELHDSPFSGGVDVALG